jgi:L-threonylcarbamoyladenylate synthase
MESMKLDFNTDIREALKVLKRGGVILYPTDTIWGLGCDPTNEDAIRRIYEIKRREDSKSLLVLVSDTGMLERYVTEIPDAAYQLIEATDSPLTIIYPNAKNVHSLILAEDGSLGIRIPDDEFLQALIIAFRKPLVSTSANLSGNPSPATFREISRELIQEVDYVVKFKQQDTQPAKASSIIKIDAQNRIQIIRP